MFPASYPNFSIFHVYNLLSITFHPLIVTGHNEPTNNLDSRNVKKVLDMFGEVRQKLGTTVIVASHDERVEGYAQQIIDTTTRGINPSNNI